MKKYLALLRGINVGGGNKIAMTDLRACLEAEGFTNVVTYIQSGNVMFDSPETDMVKITQRLEEALSKRFAPYKAKVVVRSHEQLKRIVKQAPKMFGAHPADYRYYVLFLKEPLTTAGALPLIPLKEGVDQAWAGPDDVIFHARVEARATQSHLNKLVAMPIYQDMTIRNWNTTTKLLSLMDA